MPLFSRRRLDDATPSRAEQTLCLCMIVRDEAAVIERCLASVRPLITHWLVVDTGSRDATQILVRLALGDLPGELVERPWIDFAHNRSEALALARPRADYSLIIDADDELVVPDGFVPPALDADSYVLDIQDTGVAYRRTQLVSNRLPWRYRGVLHEFLTCEEATSTGNLPLAMRRNHDGARRRDPATYRRDAAVLERALANEADPFMVARYTFYLAQSRRDCGDREGALAAYLARAELGHWSEEVYVALLEAGRLMEGLGRDLDDTLATYARAGTASPGRAEAAHGAARLCRQKGRHEQGYASAKPALGLPPPPDGLFVEPWIYGFGLLDEFAVNASWTGRHADCRDACRAVLARPDLPVADRARVAGNLRFAEERLAARWAEPNAGWRPERPLGGTELMLEGLRARLGAELDRVNLCVTGYDTPDARPLVVWIQHDIDQAAVQWLADPARAARVDRFVFVSDWQRARYLARFALPPERCRVIRNATDVPPIDRPWTPRPKLRLAYASTPYRGLAVLLDAWELLDRAGSPELELHVWSSHKLYGPGADDAAYEALYARARRLPGVRYHGIAPNAALRELLRDCDVLAYPNTFAETSCITAIEAMAAGCRVVCPEYGALPETTGGFARLYPFTPDPAMHARLFADALAAELREPWGGQPAQAVAQQRFARAAHDWSAHLAEWRELLDAMTRGPPAPSFAPLADRTTAALARLRDRGFAPAGILDAGAYRGDFARVSRHLFPAAHIVMVDALAEQEPALAEAAGEIGNAAYFIACLGARDSEAVPFFVADTAARPELVKTGSSRYRENTSFPMQQRSLPMRRLDAVLAGDDRPYALVKLDLQGAELDALAGIGSRLADVEAIVIELSLVAYNDGAPLMHEAMSRLAATGLVLAEILAEQRHGDGSLLQLDALFLRPASPYRPQPPFWS